MLHYVHPDCLLLAAEGVYSGFITAAAGYTETEPHRKNQRLELKEAKKLHRAAEWGIILFNITKT